MSTSQERLKALSIRQPRVDMILRKGKSMEIRSWNMRLRGQIALHAARAIDFSAAYLYGYHQPWKLERGAVVALAVIEDVRLLDESSWLESLEMHRQPLPMGSGAYGVVIRSVQPLRTPVPCRGHQMLFPLEQAIAERVRDALNA